MDTEEFNELNPYELGSHEISEDSEQDAISVWTNWWCWPLVPIGSVTAGFLTFYGMGLFLWINQNFYNIFESDSWHVLYIWPTITWGVVAWAWAYSAIFIAPRGKLITGVVSGTIFVMIRLMDSAVPFINSELFSTSERWLGLISVVASIIGVVAAVQTES